MSEKKIPEPAVPVQKKPLVERRRSARPFENKSIQVEERATDSAWALFEAVQNSPASDNPVPRRSTLPVSNEDHDGHDDADSAIASLIIDVDSTSPDSISNASSPEKINRPAQVDQALAEIRRQFPQIADKIDLDWGNPGCQKYLQKLLSDSYNRDQSVRAGFSTAVARALMNLLSLHP